MLPPAPKTKVDEIRDIISKAELGDIFSEFKYARCLRLLNDIQLFITQDQLTMYKSIIELYAGNYKVAKLLALKSLNSSENFRVLRNSAFVFQQVFALDLVITAIEKIVQVSSKMKIDLMETLPPGYLLNFLLSGDLEKGRTYAMGKKLEKELCELHSINEKLGVKDDAFKGVLKIVHSVLIDNQAQAIYTEYSFVEEELLITIHVNKRLDEILELNKKIAQHCYQSGLLNDLNQISYMILPTRSADI